MCIHFVPKKYKISKRDYTQDYSSIEKLKYDMTLSGKFITEREIRLNELDYLDKYPSEILQKELIKKVKNKNKILDCVFLGCGSNGILQDLIKIFSVGKKNIVTPFYTFNQVEYASTTLNLVTRRVFCDDYNINVKKILKACNKNTACIYICNPNNPTGICMSNNEINYLVERSKVPIILDESAIEFSHQKSYVENKAIKKNLIVLRTFSKAYGLSNLRIGYGVCNKEMYDYLKKNITNNLCSDVAINIAIKMCESDSINKNVYNINKEKENIIEKLENEILFIKSDSNTLMTRNTFSQSFFDELNKHEVSVVKVEDEFGGLHFRIAIQNHEINKKFIEVVKKILKEK